FALVMKQALHRSRRAIHRHCQLLAHDTYRNIESFHPAENVGHEVAAFKACGVLPERDLVVGTAVDVIKDRARHSSPRQFAEVVKIVAVAQSHAALPISVSLRLNGSTKKILSAAPRLQ